ncbi:MAG: 4-phosphoerythronate dehydrogenase PdxB [Bacteroidales bacterium]|jgi:erythronate-4-phosphate dehydrogenase|nr:4-phosphoerythronate dehydrogenase PdxB [Bacteroidales bacterium]
MKIVIDENIPFIRGAFEPWADVIYAPGGAIDSRIVADADALIVRTRTRCDSQLLKGSRVKIVASATIGYDHIDTGWLEAEGIKWTNAPGCNSGSVMQYITASLFHLALNHSLDLHSLTIGVVGIGNVGSKVVRAARTLGMNVLQNDPPRKRREGLKEFISLDTLLERSDIVTLHVPLTTEGHDKTHYLINRENLQALKRDCILINTSRGEVVDNIALRKSLSAGTLGGAVLDVWEGEPRADRKLIGLADIATPHIAGYSVDGKANGTITVVREVASLLGIPLAGWQPGSLPVPDKPVIELDLHASMNTPLNLAAMAVRHTYPVDEDDRLFRSDPGRFEFLRDNYRQRREFGSFQVRIEDTETRKILDELGFRTIRT